MAIPDGKMPVDPAGGFDFKDERVQVCAGKVKEVLSQNEIEGTETAVLDKYEEKQTDLQATNELIEDFEIPSTKMEVGKDKQQSVQFDKLVEYLVDIVKSEPLEKVVDEFKNQSEAMQSKVEEEGLIKKGRRGWYGGES